MSVHVRVNDETYQSLKELAAELGVPLTMVVERAVGAYRRQTFLAGLAADFEALKSDTEAWATYQAEAAAWDITLGDAPVSPPSPMPRKTSARRSAIR